jgi:EmrB/QacA subfamily drug resistance transporter
MQTTIEARETAHAEMPAAPPAVRWALAGLALSMLLSALGTSIANVGLPTLAQTFNATFQQVQWVVLAYLLAVTALIVSVGRLGDIMGRRRLLLAGIFVFTAASVVCGLAPTLGLLIGARAVQGLGAAAMMSLTMALVGETVPRAQTGRAMGLLGTMSAAGTALGPSLGGVLIATFGWRAVFLAPVPLGVAALLLTRKHLPADRHSPFVRGRVDWVGTLLLAFALGAYALAMTIGRGHFGFVNLTLLAVATLSAGLFVFVETRVPAPLIRLASLKDRILTGGLLTSGLVSTVMMSTLVVGPFYLAAALGLEPSAVGLALSAGPLAAALMSVPAGRLVDRLGPRRVTVIGLLGIVTGSVTLVALPAPFGVLGYLAPIVVLTIGYALFQTANNTAVMRDVPADQRGVASSMLNLSRNLGLVTGASMMGAVFAFASNSADLTKTETAAIATGMRATFAIAAALIVVALAVALRSGARNAAPTRACNS